MSVYDDMDLETLLAKIKSTPLSVNSPLLQLKDAANATEAALDKAHSLGILVNQPITGKASDLQTKSKDTLVNAINEIYSDINKYVPMGTVYPSMQNGLSAQSSIWSSTSKPVNLDNNGSSPYTFNITKDYSTLGDQEGIGFTFLIEKVLKDGTSSYLPMVYSTNSSDISVGNKYLTDNQVPIVIRKDQNAIGSTYSVVFTGLMEGLGSSGGSSRVQIAPRMSITIGSTSLGITAFGGRDFANNTNSSNTNGAYYYISLLDIWYYEISSTNIVPLASGTVLGKFNGGTNWPMTSGTDTLGPYTATMGNILINGNWKYCGSGINITGLANRDRATDYTFSPNLSGIGVSFTTDAYNAIVSYKIPLSCLYDGFTLTCADNGDDSYGFSYVCFSIKGNSIVFPEYNGNTYKHPFGTGGTATVSTYI